MRTVRLLIPMLFGAVALAGSMSEATAAVHNPQQAARSQLGAPAATARVWFMRPTSSGSGDDWGAAPMVYANGAPIAPVPTNAAFYRDFAPGAYTFTVAPYGLPTGQADTVSLAPGSQSYLEVEWEPAWEFGYPSSSRGANSHSFFVVNFPSQLAQAYLPTLSYLGER